MYVCMYVCMYLLSFGVRVLHDFVWTLFFLLYKCIYISIYMSSYMSFLTLLSSSLPFLRVMEFYTGRGSSLVLDFEWLEFGAQPKRIVSYFGFLMKL